MVEPLSLAVKLVNALVESSSEVKTNHEDCALLVDRAKQTLAMLNHVQSRVVADRSVVEAIRYLNKSLKRAQDAIDNCCNANYISALLHRRTHSMELQRAEKDINHALLQIPLAALGMTSKIQDDLASLVDDKSHEKLDERASRVHQTNMLKTEIEDVRNQMNQSFEDVKNQIGQRMEKLGLRLETIGVLVPTANLVNDISNVATKAKLNKEGCNQVASFAERALRLLKMFEERALSNSPVMVALSQVNDALANAKQSIVDCCATHVFLGTSFRQSYPSILQKAMKELANAISKIPLTMEGIPANMQAALSKLCNDIHDSKFDGSVDVKRDSALSEQPKDFVEASQSALVYDGPFPLHFAVSKNWIDFVKELIANGANVNTQDKDCRTPLWIASHNNHIGIVKELIANGAEVNLPNKNGSFPLYIASRYGYLEVVKELIARGGDVNLQNYAGWSSLHIASYMNHNDIIKEFIANGANVYAQDNDGDTPLHRAAQNGSTDSVKIFIDDGAKVDFPNKKGQSPLHHAAFRNHIDVVKVLIANGANVNLQDNNGWIPLLDASYNNSVDTVKELIAYGANINLPNKNGASPLYLASRYGYLEVVKELIHKGAIVNLQNNSGRSVLHTASEEGNVEVVKELIAKGWDVNLQDNKGWTPLHDASSYGRIYVVQTLLEHGALKRIRDHWRRKPYHVVCFYTSLTPYEKKTIRKLKFLLWW